jgi:endogenous inhibitor of DNA gyrase (YacG/DUF329 family)
MPAASKCPICKREIPASEGMPAFGPFCSARCRSIDLGCWLDGRYAISSTPEESEDETALPPEVENGKN